MQGLILVAHGSRDPSWVAPFARVHERLAAQLGPQRVALAFLESMPPTPSVAAQTLVDHGCTRLVLLPLFLGTGKHARADMQACLADLQTTHPLVRVELHPSLGEQDVVLDAIVDIGRRAVDSAAYAKTNDR
jgi:sirohydrochlorin cobaltochelatase